MLLKLFKGNQPVLIIIIPLFTGFLWIKSFIDPSDIKLNFDLTEMPLWHFINLNTAGLNIIRKIVAFILLIANSLWLSRISTKFILVKARTYLPALFYGFICSGMVFLQDLNPTLFAVTFLIPAIEKMFDSYKEEKLSYKYFEAALLISVGSMFYSRAALFMFILWTALAILRTPNWREWTTSAIGFILPYIFLTLILYLLDKDIVEYYYNIASNFSISRDVNYFNLFSIINYSFLLFLVAISSFQMIRIYQGLKIYARMYYRIFFWMFILTLIFGVAFYNQSAELIYFLAIPISYILTYYFYSLKLDWLGEIMFTCFIIVTGLSVAMG
jgi:hypothetical protein